MNIITTAGLEQRIDTGLFLHSYDTILADYVISHFNFQPEHTLRPIKPQDLESIAESSGVHVYDLHSRTSTDYPLFVTIAHHLTAINPSTKVILLATQNQQDSKQFNPIKRLQETSRATVYSRPHVPTTREGKNQGRDHYGVLIHHLFGEIVRDVMRPPLRNGNLEEATIVKVGGSIFDPYETHPEFLYNLLSAVVEAHNQHNRLILTVGGGPSQSVSREMATRFGLPDDITSESAANVLDGQAKTVAYLLNRIKSGLAHYLNPDGANVVLKGNYINRELLDNQIPVFSLLPRDASDLGLPDDIPRDKSDAHAVYLANHFGVRNVIFAKDTPGIYERDPRIPQDRLDELGFKRDNNFIRFLYADEVGTRIQRRGLEPNGSITDEHLIETAALKPFIDLKYPTTIHIIDGTKPDNLLKALKGEVTGSYILKP